MARSAGKSRTALWNLLKKHDISPKQFRKLRGSMTPYLKKEDISRMILTYLQKNPEAGDTSEGISRWWLEQRKIDIPVNKVSEALEILVKKGTVKIEKKRDGNTYQYNDLKSSLRKAYIKEPNGQYLNQTTKHYGPS